MKKILALVLATILILSVAACGAAPAGGSGAASVSTQSKQQSDNAPAANDAADGEVVQLKFLFGQDNFDPMTDYTRELIKELLNVEIIPEMGNEDDKVSLILSSGQEYDMIKLTNRNLHDTFIKNDAIYSLDEYIEQNQTLKSAFSDEVWNMMSSNDKIYGIPEMNTEDIEWGIAMRGDWLEALGAEMPKTPDEFYEILKRFKEEDPGGVGKENVVPFTCENQLSFNGLAQAFGIGERIDGVVEKNGRLEASIEQPGAKEFVTFLNRLYKEGLLDSDFPANRNDNVANKLAAGIAGSAKITAWESGTLRTIRETTPGATLTFLTPLKGADGSQGIINRAGLKNYVIIPKASKKVAEVVKYCSDFLEPEFYTRLILGEENVTYTVENDVYLPKFPEFDIMNRGRWFYPTNEGERYTPLFSARAHKEAEMGELWDDLNTKGKDYVYTYVMNYSPLFPELEDVRQKLVEQTREKIIMMIIDENELANFDSFVQEWKANGGDRIMDAYNTWYQNR